ncbi:MAG: 3-isopropylmalate dehydratase small subunit [Chloroflexota bacterium]|nr:3-isopropylmalate dehydratase [Chloroflexota bacterium]NOG63240.1 3-isopropylmalate dehydratase [Chloroflexota bacterium]GIK64498.1 MAG: 3-isopropylmalate dehydratase small subunit [Chloroflexota bacterium]
MSSHRCWVYGDNVNTDVIFPGKYTYTLKTPEEIAAHALEDLDSTFAANVRRGDVIVAGQNWGCGSSREQGVTAPKYAGVDIIIAASFSRIYFRNCINQGVLPIVCPGLNTLVQTGDAIEIDITNGQIHAAGQTFTFPRLSPSVQAILDAGGLVPMLQRRFAGESQP